MRTGHSRSPVVVLILSFLLFPFYYLYWVYKVSGEVQDALGEPDISPGLEVLLLIITGGLYTLYWDYKISRKIARLQQQMGLPIADNGVLYIVLDLIGLGFVNALMEQSNLNEIWQVARQTTRHPVRY